MIWSYKILFSPENIKRVLKQFSFDMQVRSILIRLRETSIELFPLFLGWSLCWCQDTFDNQVLETGGLYKQGTDHCIGQFLLTLYIHISASQT